MKQKTWKSKLTKTELKHLKDSGVMTKAGLENNFSEQHRLRAINSSFEPCYECKSIAIKLGYPI